MSEEIELASKTAGEVAGHVSEVFVEKSGIFEPAHALATALTTGIDAAFYPGLFRICRWAADRIERVGASRRAIETMPPRLLRGILEGGAMEPDEGMQDRWANLLANAATNSEAEVRRAFPEILRQLDPQDVRILDELAGQASDETFLVENLIPDPTTRDGVSLDNLTALELLRPVYRTATTVGSITVDPSTIAAYVFNERGWAFVKACQPPLAGT
jgi:hypothetical protein